MSFRGFFRLWRRRLRRMKWKQFCNGSEVRGRNWRKGQRAFRSEPLLVMLDEFPWFLSFVAKKTSPNEVEAVLQWFRSARQELAERPARFPIGAVARDVG